MPIGNVVEPDINGQHVGDVVKYEKDARWLSQHLRLKKCSQPVQFMEPSSSIGKGNM